MTDPAPEPSPWRDPRFRIFAAGNTINNIGEGAYDLALPLLAYQLTRSLGLMAVLAAFTPATLLLGPVFGAAVDRWGPRCLVVPGLTLQLVASALLNVVALRGGQASIPLLAVLGAFVQIGGSAYRVGWMTGVPEMFPDCPVRARGTLSSLFVGTTIAGPVVVAVLVGPIGYTGLIWVNTVTFLAPAVVWLLGVHPARRPPRDGHEGFRVTVANGWAAIRDRPVLLAVTLALIPLEFVTSAVVPTLATFHLRNEAHVPANLVSVFFVLINLGGLAGALSVSERRRFDPARALTLAAAGLAVGSFGAGSGMPAISVPALVVFQFFNGGCGSATSMLIVQSLPQETLGRASGLIRLINGVPFVLGPLLVVPLQHTFGSTATFAVLGVLCCLALAALRGSGLRARNEMRRPRTRWLPFAR